MNSTTIHSNLELKEITNLLIEGFHDKFQPLRLSEKDLRHLNHCLVEHLVNNFHDHFLMIKNNTIEGILFIKPYKWKAMKLTRQLFKQFDFKTFLKAIIFLIAFDHSPKKNEIHIDFITISKSSRRKGVGTQLIKFLQDKINDHQYITLYVNEKNVAARRLYEKQGFQVKKKGSSRWGKHLHGIEQWYLMEWKGTCDNEKKR
ncbi:GNAT family N-acetyltransferase [Bacillus sp. B1-b2]|uniref:GNAT family N-acetyltransferase n=1 Tax=Bacillus sp. B1-b2 TaxID=2653201 RepID=UPI001261E6A4|nr:N-acetyltransferase [Bacillus sp. B1-b2]KAB7672176.1 GNAT family N-acetyltransferase [Bacillus sp. B1-b2]